MFVVMGAVVGIPSRSMRRCKTTFSSDVPARWVDVRGAVVAAIFVEGIVRSERMIEKDSKRRDQITSGNYDSGHELRCCYWIYVHDQQLLQGRGG